MNGAIGAGTVLRSLCSAVIIQYGVLSEFCDGYNIVDVNVFNI